MACRKLLRAVHEAETAEAHIKAAAWSENPAVLRAVLRQAIEAGLPPSSYEKVRRGTGVPWACNARATCLLPTVDGKAARPLHDHYTSVDGKTQRCNGVTT